MALPSPKRPSYQCIHTIWWASTNEWCL